MSPFATQTTPPAGVHKSPLRIERWQIALVAGAFLVYGLVNGLNHMLIQQFMRAFALTRLQAGWMQPTYYIGYALAPLPTAMIVRRSGYKPALIGGLGCLALASALVAFAIHAGHFLPVLPPIFLLAYAVSTLESSGNPYLLTSAPGERGVRRLFFAHSITSIGMIGGSVLGTFMVFPQADASIVSVSEEIHRATLPFLLFAVLSVLLLVWALGFPFPDRVSREAMQRKALLAPLRSPAFRAALFTAFIYMAVQICTWSFLLQYARQFGFASDRAAGMLVIASMVLFALGRLLQTFVLPAAGSPRLLLGAAVFGVATVAFAVVAPGVTGACSLVLSSLFMSVMNPTIFALGVQPMGTQAAAAGSLMTFGLLGGAVIPPLMARFAEATASYATAFLIPCLGYAWIAAFAWFCSRRPAVA